jgi:ATP-dependent HslUV protease subunit HslV
MAGDGQVSMGQTIVKGNAKKVRRSATARSSPVSPAPRPTPSPVRAARGQARAPSRPLLRACIELAKDWRTDRYLRRLEALMAVADKDVSLLLSGTGDVLEPKAASSPSARAATMRWPRRAR